MIPIAKPYINKAEQNAVIKVLQSGIIARGPRVAEFEEKFAKACDTKYAIATSSGTASLHVSLHVLGIGEGDEVITTPFTFVATAHSILMVGAVPVFVDIDPVSFNLDADLIEAKITKKTKAIVAVNLYGQPAEYKKINKLAKKYNLFVVEDAAQSIGSTYYKKASGNLGDISCFSLYATKNITTGEGGMITTNSKDLNSKSILFRHHSQNPKKAYGYAGLGFNYETTDISAAIGLEQLKKLKAITKRRQIIAKEYDKAFENIPGLITPVVKNNRTHVYHQYTMRVTKDFKLSRNEFIAQLNSKAVMARVYYPEALYRFKHLNYFDYKAKDFPVVEQMIKEVVSIPIHPGLTTKQIKYIIKTIRNI